MTSLYLVACLSGTLHGAPTELCKEFQVRSFGTVSKCEAAVKAGATEEWLKGMRAIGIDPEVRGVRCGPAEKDDDDI